MATSDNQTVYTGPKELSKAIYVSEVWVELLEKLNQLGASSVRLLDGTEISVPEAAQRALAYTESVDTDSIKLSGGVVKQTYTNLEYEIGAATAILIKDGRGAVSVDLSVIQSNLPLGTKILSSYLTITDDKGTLLGKREVLGSVIDLGDKAKDAFQIRFLATLSRQDEQLNMTFAVPFDYVGKNGRSVVPLLISSLSNNPKPTVNLTDLLNQVVLRLTKIESKLAQ